MNRGGRSEESGFSALLVKVYEAAAQSSAWGQALKAVRRYLQTQSAILFTEDLTSHEVELSVLEKADRKLVQEYYDHYIHKSPLLKAKLRVPFGEVTATNMLMPDREWERHEFYYDFLRRCERFYEMGALIGKRDDSVSVVSLIRSRRAGGFSLREAATLRQLVPHLRRAFDIGRRIGRVSAGQATLAALLDRLTMGVILFDEQAQPVHLNRRAEEMLGDAGGFGFKHRQVVTAVQDEAEALQTLLHRVIQTGCGDGRHPGAGQTVQRSSPGGPLKVLVTPLRAEHMPTGLGRAQIRAAMFLSEPQSAATIRLELLKEMFSLTEAEALVVRELANGRSPQEISRALHISWHTVRTQQRAIYDKLGVTSQTQLVKTVWSGPASLETR